MWQEYKKKIKYSTIGGALGMGTGMYLGAREEARVARLKKSS